MEELKLINATTKINEDNTFGLALEYLTNDNKKLVLECYKVAPILEELKITEDNFNNFCFKVLFDKKENSFAEIKEINNIN